MSEPSTIADAAISCRQTLQRCVDIPSLRKDGWVENRLIDFNLWSAGSGACAKGKVSLDDRLLLKLEIRDVIVNLLLMLQIFAENYLKLAESRTSCQKLLTTANSDDDDNVSIRKGEYSASLGSNPRQSTWDSQKLEVRRDVEETLDHIIRLVVAVRKAGSSARLQKADSSFNPGSPQLQELKRLLEISLPPRGLKTAEQMTDVQIRLIKANLRRHHRFIYARKHSKKLATGPAEAPASQQKTHEASDPGKPQGEARDEESSQPRLAGFNEPEPKPSLISSTVDTTASAIEGPILTPEGKPKKAAATVISYTTSKVAYPRPPRIRDNRNVFKCPCCCQPLPMYFSEPSQWKKHLASDIFPYTCILDSCTRPAQLYLTRKDWEDHMNKDHGFQYWSCFACQQIDAVAKFEKKSELVSHLETSHQDSIEPDELLMFVEASLQTKPAEIRSCPVCTTPEEEHKLNTGEGGTNLLNHIAQCVHDFSLMSLPWGAPDDQDGFFASNSGQGSSQNPGSISKDDRDSEGLPELDCFSEPDNHVHDRQLTEAAMKSISISLDEEPILDKWFANIILSEDAIWQNSGDVPDTNSGTFLGHTDQKKSKPSQNCAVAKDELFSYRPLRNHREIRLLELLPGGDEMPLKGIIHHVSVDSPGQYWAISYVWGAPLKLFYFQTCEGKIPITVSLHGALQCIRDRKVSTLLWADAICIDQEKCLEKSFQIRLMRTIFQSAEGVIAWLGDEKDNSDRAIETLLQIRMITLKPDVWPDGLPAVPLSWAGRNIPSITDNAWEDINLFFSRDWFRRSWIVQELILASNVMIFCGKWTLNWDDFFEAVKICRDGIQSEMDYSNPEQGLILSYSDPAYALGLTRQSRLRFNDVISSRRYNLLELLDLFAYTKATWERDKLFALLGLASDCHEKAFDPDYESTMDAIVRRYANEFVQRGYAMDLLYKAGTSKSYPFCSWIPFWTRENFPKTISSWCGAGGNFCAGGRGHSYAHLDPINAYTLVVRGFLFDTIVQISDTKTDKSDIISFINSIHVSIDSIKWYPTGESRQELKLKLPIGSAGRPYLESTKGFVPQQIIAVAESKQEDWLLELEHKISSISSIQEMMNFLKKPQDARDVVWKYWQTAAAFASRISNGTFCVTKMGYIGLVPGDGQVGDKVCIFSGGAVPFVVRKESSREIYRLIGEGYIHGLMYGEALSFKHIYEKDFSIV